MALMTTSFNSSVLSVADAVPSPINGMGRRLSDEVIVVSGMDTIFCIYRSTFSLITEKKFYKKSSQKDVLFMEKHTCK
ncbi:hypothetical protein Hanom_Chr08g00719001 [Helianthus anomalus]